MPPAKKKPAPTAKKKPKPKDPKPAADPVSRIQRTRSSGRGGRGR
jgi:hypothetical protein